MADKHEDGSAENPENGNIMKIGHQENMTSGKHEIRKIGHQENRK